jgi:metal-responsive CopG/Arc/MetJ family transcriptional regulator
VVVRLNRQQLELLDRTVRRLGGPSREEVIRQALRETGRRATETGRRS